GCRAVIGPHAFQPVVDDDVADAELTLLEGPALRLQRVDGPGGDDGLARGGAGSRGGGLLDGRGGRGHRRGVRRRRGRGGRGRLDGRAARSQGEDGQEGAGSKGASSLHEVRGGGGGAAQGCGTSRNKDRNGSCRMPLVASAESADRVSLPSKAVMRPPASRTMGTAAAMSYSLTSNSATMSRRPSASSM